MHHLFNARGPGAAHQVFDSLDVAAPKLATVAHAEAVGSTDVVNRGNATARRFKRGPILQAAAGDFHGIAEKTARNLVLDQQATWPQLLAAVERYAKLVEATNRSILNPSNFFGAADRPWSHAWEVPAGKSAHRPTAPDHSAQWAALEERAKILGHRLPDRLRETPAAFKTLLDLAERPKGSVLAQISNLADRKRIN